MSITRLLHLAAALVALATVGTWLATGAHRGWSRDQIPVTVVDDITGIETLQFRDGFVAGVDTLALGLGTAVALTGAAVFLSRRRKTAPAT